MICLLHLLLCSYFEWQNKRQVLCNCTFKNCPIHKTPFSWHFLSSKNSNWHYVSKIIHRKHRFVRTGDKFLPPLPTLFHISSSCKKIWHSGVFTIFHLFVGFSLHTIPPILLQVFKGTQKNTKCIHSSKVNKRRTLPLCSTFQ